MAIGSRPLEQMETSVPLSESGLHGSRKIQVIAEYMPWICVSMAVAHTHV